MSIFRGQLVSMTAALEHEAYGRMLRPQSSPAERMAALKFAAVVIGGVAITFGCFVEPLEINFMVGQAFAIAAAGMLSGALYALSAATLTNLGTLALDKGPRGKLFADFAPLNGFWAHHPWLPILCEEPAIWTVPLAIGLMIIDSKLTATTVPADIRLKMRQLPAPEKLGLKQKCIQEHAAGGGH